MPRSYKHVKQYEKEIIEMFEEGKSLKEIGVELGFTQTNARFQNKIQQKTTNDRSRKSI